MKRLTMLIGTIVVSCLVLFGFRKSFETATAGDPQTIIVYNWGDYIDPELITQFEQETGYKVIYETFDSNEAMLTKELSKVERTTISPFQVSTPFIKWSKKTYLKN